MYSMMGMIDTTRKSLMQGIRSAIYEAFRIIECRPEADSPVTWWDM